jgi:D-3-phosphoglycerate dehydrogenase
MKNQPRILLTHTPDMRRNYYGGRALAGLQALGEIALHEGPEPLATPALIAAARVSPSPR